MSVRRAMFVFGVFASRCVCGRCFRFSVLFFLRGGAEVTKHELWKLTVTGAYVLSGLHLD